MNKFNWGHGIFIFYVVFVLIVIGAFYASTQVDHSLVTKDYYVKDLAYQSHLDKLKNNQKDNILDVQHSAGDDQVVFIFATNSDVKGKIYFYRPSDKSLDFSIVIDQQKIVVNTNKLNRGKWVIKADWTIDSKPYYKEAQLFI